MKKPTSFWSLVFFTFAACGAETRLGTTDPTSTESSITSRSPAVIATGQVGKLTVQVLHSVQVFRVTQESLTLKLIDAETGQVVKEETLLSQISSAFFSSTAT